MRGSQVEFPGLQINTPEDCLLVLQGLAGEGQHLPSELVTDLLLEILQQVHDQDRHGPSRGLAYATDPHSHASPVQTGGGHTSLMGLGRRPGGSAACDEASSSHSSNAQWVLCLRVLLRVAENEPELLQELAGLIHTELVMRPALTTTLMRTLQQTLPSALTSPSNAPQSAPEAAATRPATTPAHSQHHGTQTTTAPCEGVLSGTQAAAADGLQNTTGETKLCWTSNGLRALLQSGVPPGPGDLLLVAAAASTSAVGGVDVHAGSGPPPQEYAWQAMAHICLCCKTSDLVSLMDLTMRTLPDMGSWLRAACMQLLAHASSAALAWDAHSQLMNVSNTIKHYIPTCGLLPLPKTSQNTQPTEQNHIVLQQTTAADVGVPHWMLQSPARMPHVQHMVHGGASGVGCVGTLQGSSGVVTVRGAVPHADGHMLDRAAASTGAQSVGAASAGCVDEGAGHGHAGSSGAVTPRAPASVASTRSLLRSALKKPPPPIATAGAVGWLPVGVASWADAGIKLAVVLVLGCTGGGEDSAGRGVQGTWGKSQGARGPHAHDASKVQDVSKGVLSRLLEEVAAGGGPQDRSVHWAALSVLLHQATWAAHLKWRVASLKHAPDLASHAPSNTPHAAPHAQPPSSHAAPHAHLPSSHAAPHAQQQSGHAELQLLLCELEPHCQVLDAVWRSLETVIQVLTQQLPFIMAVAPLTSAQRFLSLLTPLIPYAQPHLPRALLQAAAMSARNASAARQSTDSTHQPPPSPLSPPHPRGVAHRTLNPPHGTHPPGPLTFSGVPTITPPSLTPGRSECDLSGDMGPPPPRPPGSAARLGWAGLEVGRPDDGQGGVVTQHVMSPGVVGVNITPMAKGKPGRGRTSPGSVGWQTPASSGMTGSTMACPSSICNSLASIGDTYDWEDPSSPHGTMIDLLPLPPRTGPGSPDLSLLPADIYTAAAAGQQLAVDLFCAAMMRGNAGELQPQRQGMFGAGDGQLGLRPLCRDVVLDTDTLDALDGDASDAVQQDEQAVLDLILGSHSDLIASHTPPCSEGALKLLANSSHQLTERLQQHLNDHTLVTVQPSPVQEGNAPVQGPVQGCVRTESLTLDTALLDALTKHVTHLLEALLLPPDRHRAKQQSHQPNPQHTQHQPNQHNTQHQRNTQHTQHQPNTHNTQHQPNQQHTQHPSAMTPKSRDPRRLSVHTLHTTDTSDRCHLGGTPLDTHYASGFWSHTTVKSMWDALRMRIGGGSELALGKGGSSAGRTVGADGGVAAAGVGSDGGATCKAAAACIASLLSLLACTVHLRMRTARDTAGQGLQSYSGVVPGADVLGGILMTAVLHRPQDPPLPAPPTNTTTHPAGLPPAPAAAAAAVAEDVSLWLEQEQQLTRLQQHLLSVMLKLCLSMGPQFSSCIHKAMVTQHIHNTSSRDHPLQSNMTSSMHQPHPQAEAHINSNHGHSMPRVGCPMCVLLMRTAEEDVHAHAGSCDRDVSIMLLRGIVQAHADSTQRLKAAQLTFEAAQQAATITAAAALTADAVGVTGGAQKGVGSTVVDGGCKGGKAGDAGAAAAGGEEQRDVPAAAQGFFVNRVVTVGAASGVCVAGGAGPGKRMVAGGGHGVLEVMAGAVQSLPAWVLRSEDTAILMQLLSDHKGPESDLAVDGIGDGSMGNAGGVGVRGGGLVPLQDVLAYCLAWVQASAAAGGGRAAVARVRKRLRETGTGGDQDMAPATVLCRSAAVVLQRQVQGTGQFPASSAGRVRRRQAEKCGAVQLLPSLPALLADTFRDGTCGDSGGADVTSTTAVLMLLVQQMPLLAAAARRQPSTAMPTYGSSNGDQPFESHGGNTKANSTSCASSTATAWGLHGRVCEDGGGGCLLELVEQLVPAQQRDDAARAALLLLHSDRGRSSWIMAGRLARVQPCLGAALAVLLQVYSVLPLLAQYRASLASQPPLPPDAPPLPCPSARALSAARLLVPTYVSLAAALIDVACSEAGDPCVQELQPAPLKKRLASVAVVTVGDGDTPAEERLCETAAGDGDEAAAQGQGRGREAVTGEGRHRQELASLGALCGQLARHLLSGFDSLPDLLGPNPQLLSPLLRLSCSTSLPGEGLATPTSHHPSTTSTQRCATAARAASGLPTTSNTKPAAVGSADEGKEVVVWCSRLVAQVLRGQQQAGDNSVSPLGQRTGGEKRVGGRRSRPQLLCPLFLLRKLTHEQPVQRPQAKGSVMVALAAATAVAAAAGASTAGDGRTLRHRDTAVDHTRKAVGGLHQRGAARSGRHDGGASGHGGGMDGGGTAQPLGYAGWAQKPGGMSQELATGMMLSLLGCLWRRLRLHAHALSDAIIKQDMQEEEEVEGLGGGGADRHLGQGTDNLGQATLEQRTQHEGSNITGMQAMQRRTVAVRELVVGTDSFDVDLLHPESLIITCAAVLNASAWMAALAGSAATADDSVQHPLQQQRAGVDKQGGGVGGGTARRFWQQAMLGLHNLLSVCSLTAADLAIYLCHHRDQCMQRITHNPITQPPTNPQPPPAVTVVPTPTDPHNPALPLPLAPIQGVAGPRAVTDLGHAPTTLDRAPNTMPPWPPESQLARACSMVAMGMTAAVVAEQVIADVKALDPNQPNQQLATAPAAPASAGVGTVQHRLLPVDKQTRALLHQARVLMRTLQLFKARQDTLLQCITTNPSNTHTLAATTAAAPPPATSSGVTTAAPQSGSQLGLAQQGSGVELHAKLQHRVQSVLAAAIQCAASQPQPHGNHLLVSGVGDVAGAGVSGRKVKGKRRAGQGPLGRARDAGRVALVGLGGNVEQCEDGEGVQGEEGQENQEEVMVQVPVWAPRKPFTSEPCDIIGDPLDLTLDLFMDLGPYGGQASDDDEEEEEEEGEHGSDVDEEEDGEVDEDGEGDGDGGEGAEDMAGLMEALQRRDARSGRGGGGGVVGLALGGSAGVLKSGRQQSPLSNRQSTGAGARGTDQDERIKGKGSKSHAKRSGTAATSAGDSAPVAATVTVALVTLAGGNRTRAAVPAPATAAASTRTATGQSLVLSKTTATTSTTTVLRRQRQPPTATTTITMSSASPTHIAQGRLQPQKQALIPSLPTKTATAPPQAMPVSASPSMPPPRNTTATVGSSKGGSKGVSKVAQGTSKVSSYAVSKGSSSTGTHRHSSGSTQSGSRRGAIHQRRGMQRDEAGMLSNADEGDGGDDQYRDQLLTPASPNIEDSAHGWARIKTVASLDGGTEALPQITNAVMEAHRVVEKYRASKDAQTKPAMPPFAPTPTHVSAGQEKVAPPTRGIAAMAALAGRQAAAVDVLTHPTTHHATESFVDTALGLLPSSVVLPRLKISSRTAPASGKPAAPGLLAPNQGNLPAAHPHPSSTTQQTAHASNRAHRKIQTTSIKPTNQPTNQQQARPTSEAETLQQLQPRPTATTAAPKGNKRQLRYNPPADASMPASTQGQISHAVHTRASTAALSSGPSPRPSQAASSVYRRRQEHGSWMVNTAPWLRATFSAADVLHSPRTAARSEVVGLVTGAGAGAAQTERGGSKRKDHCDVDRSGAGQPMPQPQPQPLQPRRADGRFLSRKERAAQAAGGGVGSRKVSAVVVSDSDDADDDTDVDEPRQLAPEMMQPPAAGGVKRKRARGTVQQQPAQQQERRTVGSDGSDQDGGAGGDGGGDDSRGVDNRQPRRSGVERPRAQVRKGKLASAAGGRASGAQGSARMDADRRDGAARSGLGSEEAERGIGQGRQSGGQGGSGGKSIVKKRRRVDGKGASVGVGVGAGPSVDALGVPANLNPYVSACMAERARKKPPKGTAKSCGKQAAGGSKRSAGGMEGSSEGGWSDLDDFIVCQPGRNYAQLLTNRFQDCGGSSSSYTSESEGE